jgi:hypothetical protein
MKEIKRNRDSPVGIVMDYGRESRGLIPGKSKRFFSTPQRPDGLDQLWGSPNLLSNGYPGSLPHRYAEGA